MKKFNWVVGSMILISYMYWLADRIHSIEVIFLEVVALAIGFCIYPNQEWTKNTCNFGCLQQ
ncbi:hypothetical protein [Aquibacillus sediminis]|uniref:hypothetical protein n=1 Tax=Aquibacillus sediminis TaxID=2574734 RepID=UPI0014869CF2|nr:hypothetical protein [Aquibacillus sediminis]